MGRLLKLYERQDIGVVSLIEMQFRTNIIAFVTRTSNIGQELSNDSMIQDLEQSLSFQSEGRINVLE